ncbi:MAG: peptidoglycan-binding protein [Lysobacterales bacterium]
MKMIKWSALAMSAALVTGCTGVSEQSTSTPRVSSELQQAEQQIADLKTQLNQRDKELMKAREMSSTQTTGMATESSLFPPNPKVGECYARILTPATYKSTSERVLKKEKSQRIEVSPARFENAQERVLVKEASSRLEVVPAVYGTVEERVLIRPASTRLEEVPATYKTVTERLLEKPAHTLWKRGPAAGQAGTVLAEQVASDTGEIMCLVEVPATYKTVSRTVLDRAASTREVKIPAEYKMVTRRVVKTPATTRTVTIPAEYSMVDVTKMVQPAKETRIDIPAEYANVTKTEKVTDSFLEWESVLCEVNMTKSNVTSLQRALATAGHYDGPVDGIMGKQTLRAAKSYADAKRLPAGSNYIAMDVIKALKINI